MSAFYIEEKEMGRLVVKTNNLTRIALLWHQSVRKYFSSAIFHDLDSFDSHVVKVGQCFLFVLM